MTLAEKQRQLIEDFSCFEDPHERLSAVIDRARKIPPLGAAERVDSNRVLGCISVVRLSGTVRDGRCHFRSDADSPLVRRLVALVAEFFSGVPAAEITGLDADPLAALRLVENLSPTRRNGLTAVRAAIQALAAKHAHQAT
ncbi:MAG: SufE family protein [Opitutus sp.]|nr:SufE family protein [Opitutus sp.]